MASKQITQKYDILRETSKPLGLTYARGHTKASAMAYNHVSQQNFYKSSAAKSSDNLFKMSKFRNVQGRTNTNNGTFSRATKK